MDKNFHIVAKYFSLWIFYLLHYESTDGQSELHIGNSSFLSFITANKKYILISLCYSWTHCKLKSIFALKIYHHIEKKEINKYDADKFCIQTNQISKNNLTLWDRGLLLGRFFNDFLSGFVYRHISWYLSFFLKIF